MADRPIEGSAVKAAHGGGALVLAAKHSHLGRPEVPYLGIKYARGSGRVRDLSKTQMEVRDTILAGDQASDYETVLCPCNLAGPDILLATVERHGLDCRNVVCSRCGLVRISPRWNEDRYAHFYEVEYRNLYNRIQSSKEDFAKSTSKSPWVLGFGEWVKSVVARHCKVPEPRVLEIGSGAGWNLSTLSATWKRTGFDVDREYLEVGQRLFGLTMKFGLLSEALDDVSQSDVIILSHVVEHFMDPKTSLASIATRMRPDALLLIEVPGIFRIHRTALDPMNYLQNAHTFTFCSQTLNGTCAAASLRVLESNEICRAVCLPAAASSQARTDANLPGTILRYLKLCEIGCRLLDALRGVPLAGKLLAAAGRRLWFPFLKILVPTPTTPH